MRSLRLAAGDERAQLVLVLVKKPKSKPTETVVFPKTQPKPTDLGQCETVTTLIVRHVSFAQISCNTLLLYLLDGLIGKCCDKFSEFRGFVV